ncbi:unnamed protein product [Urochloa decumbens]|uniref:Desiccation-related protein PCC13-62 n=1 Tax=Urochloa decumbens TaxID=240449 RepID=A0ABC8Y7H7_9POAL
MASPWSRAAAPFLLLLLLQLCSWGVALPDQFVDPTCPQQPLPAALAALLPNYGGPVCKPPAPHVPVAVFPYDVDPVQFALNLEYTEAEFFLHGAYGEGLDQIAPVMAMGGPPPVGARKANLDEKTLPVIKEFALQEVGHIRAIKRTVGGIRRPLIDLSADNFARVMDQAFGYVLNPPFDPYVNSLNFLLACYVIPYLGINGYVGTNPIIDGYKTKEAADATEIYACDVCSSWQGCWVWRQGRTRCSGRSSSSAAARPCRRTTSRWAVAEFTDRVSALRNRLGRCGVKDEGLTVPRELGAEGAICTNVLSADKDSLSYARTPAELLGILYLTGDEGKPGGFYPEGANGKIARSFLGN